MRRSYAAARTQHFKRFSRQLVATVSCTWPLRARRTLRATSARDSILNSGSALGYTPDTTELMCKLEVIQHGSYF